MKACAGESRGLTLVEVVICIVIIAVLVLVVLPALISPRPHGRANCQNHLKQMGLVFKMYSNESTDELFPPIQFEAISREEISLATMPLIDALCPEYLTDPYVFVCPQDEDTADSVRNTEGGWLFTSDFSAKSRLDCSYAYLGWVLDRCGDADPQDSPGLYALAANLRALGLDALAIPRNATAPAQLTGLLNGVLEEAVAKLDAPDLPGTVREAANKDRVLVGNHEAFGNKDTNKVYRLREGVERMFITDAEAPEAAWTAQSKIAVMFDVLSVDAGVFNHIDTETEAPGCNVLFMDGHVEFVRFPGPAPVSQAMAAPIGLLAGAG